MWTAVLDELHESMTFWVAGALLLTALVVLRLAPADRKRLRTMAALLGLHLVLALTAAGLREVGARAYTTVHAISVLTLVAAAVGMGVTLVFSALLPRLGLRLPRIIQDLTGAVGMIVATVALASAAGVNLSGLIATSAVLTAVIGLAFQDTLGNVMGGLVLQTEGTLRVGDWIRFDDVVGRIVDVRWRYTAIETRNWETLVIPNGTLVKNKVMVLGRRTGMPTLWRRWVWFNVDFRFPPQEVIDAVNAALVAAPIPRVATEPAPHALCMDLGESAARYAVRYWLNDLAVDDLTDSAIRARIFLALKRAGIPPAIPAAARFVSQTTERDERQAVRFRQRCKEAIAATELFSHLPEEDRAVLADGLRYAPFTRGEVITRQGAEAHWLYLLRHGEVSVRVTQDGIEKEVNHLGPGDFFGEMSLMTGERRLATVVALTDVECYRLDRHVFEQIIHNRPQLAEEVGNVLAERRLKLVAVRDDLDHEAAARRLAQTRTDVVKRIRTFFGLNEPERGEPEDR
ncbi:MAG: hypothetical protein AMXMBFR64_08390 [Myxococcales bacterium]